MLIEISELLRVWIDGKLCIQECRDESEIYNYQRIRLSQNKFINGILRGGGGVPLNWLHCNGHFPARWRYSLPKAVVLERFDSIRFRCEVSSTIFELNNYSRTPLFRTRLIRSPRYFEGRSNALGFTLPLYASPVISKPRYFELFSISLGTSK